AGERRVELSAENIVVRFGAAVPDLHVMVPAGMADMDMVRARVLSEHIARQNAGNAHRRVAVALTVFFRDVECRGPAAVAPQPVRGLVEIIVASHLPAVTRDA